MKKLLKSLVKKKYIRMIDFFFSQFISKQNNIIMLVAACVSFESNNGHIFLSLEYFQKNNFFSITDKKIIKKILFILNKNKINWLFELSKHDSFSKGNIISPLILFKKKIYLYKIWKAEKNILEYLDQKKMNNNYNLIKISQLLKKLFPKKEYNFQKIAVALSVINEVVFILGGPGTGKTTTIIKIIIALIYNTKKNIKIQLSAPTGKATKRLIEILDQYKNFNLLDSFLKEKNPLFLEPVTIHRLLGISKISNTILFNKINPLDIDVLIIDEVSMIDILMMNNIFSAIKKNTKIIFIGDHNQLSPIGIGSILKIIYNYSNDGYSTENISILKKITQYSYIYGKENKKNIFSISDKICILKKNYRFKKNSGISVLSNAIYNNKKNIFNKLFNNLIKNVFFYEINYESQYKEMINKIIFYHQEYWDQIKQKKDIKKIIKTFQKYQVLCILRDGLYGMNNINKILEQIMYQKNIIKKYFYINNKIWYLGKPIIITENNQYLNLSNGDIGITYFNNQKQLQVYFLIHNNIKCIPINILEHYETAWCTTVHKAQGSEFDHTILVIPNKNLKILNQEILYTAITRSKKRLSIFSNKKIFMIAIKKLK